MLLDPTNKGRKLKPLVLKASMKREERSDGTVDTRTVRKRPLTASDQSTREKGVNVRIVVISIGRLDSISAIAAMSSNHFDA